MKNSKNKFLTAIAAVTCPFLLPALAQSATAANPVTVAQPVVQTAIPSPTPQKKNSSVFAKEYFGKLSKEAQADTGKYVEGLPVAAKEASDLEGQKTLVVSDFDNKNGIAGNLVDYINMFASGRNPDAYKWTIVQLNKNLDEQKKYTLDSRKGKAVLEQAKEITLNPKSIYEITTILDLRGKNTDREDSVKPVVLSKKQLFDSGLDKYLVKENYIGESRNKSSVDFSTFDSIYLVPSKSLLVGGKRRTVVKVKPSDVLFDIKDDRESPNESSITPKPEYVRDVDLTNIPDDVRSKLERMIAGGSAEDNTTSGFKKNVFDVSLGYASRSSSAQVPILDGKGRIIKTVKMDGSASGPELSTDSRNSALPELIGVDQGYLAANGSVMFGSAKDSSDALELSESNGKGSANIGYLLPLGGVDIALEAGIAGLFEKFKSDKSVQLLGPDGKVILNVPSIRTELSVSHMNLDGGNYKETAGRIKHDVTKNLSAELNAVLSEYKGIQRNDFGGKVTYWLFPGKGVFAAYNMGSSTGNDSNDVKLEDKVLKLGVTVLQ